MEKLNIDTPNTASILDSLFTIETSVKSYDYYLDSFGFKGGSLGASLGEQLRNIEEIASTCGLSIIDEDWLVFAILNAGSGMIGSGKRAMLEDYFSIFASMLMFRTGSELGKQVNENMNNVQSSVSGNSMRLYSFDNVFVPASFILKTTLDALEEAYGLLQTETHSRGA